MHPVWFSPILQHDMCEEKTILLPTSVIGTSFDYCFPMFQMKTHCRVKMSKPIHLHASALTYQLNMVRPFCQFLNSFQLKLVLQIAFILTIKF